MSGDKLLCGMRINSVYVSHSSFSSSVPNCKSKVKATSRVLITKKVGRSCAPVASGSSQRTCDLRSARRK
jgi:hypothetical protein